LPYRLLNHGQTYRDTPVYRYTPIKCIIKKVLGKIQFNA
jgi:hypothetical protein